MADEQPFDRTWTAVVRLSGIEYGEDLGLLMSLVDVALSTPIGDMLHPIETPQLQPYGGETPGVVFTFSFLDERSPQPAEVTSAAPKKSSAKKSAPKKSAPKKSAQKKSSAKKSAPKTTAAKKSSAEQTAAKKTSPKKAAPQKSSPTKSAAKKSVAKKLATNRPVKGARKAR